MNPQLKRLLRQIKRKFFENRKSMKWRKLKTKFKRLKKKSVREFYSNFVNNLKESNPAKWYTMAKRFVAEKNFDDDNLVVEILNGMTEAEASEEIAVHFSKTRNLRSRLICHRN